MPVKCSNCDFVNLDINRFCGGCGLRLFNSGSATVEQQATVEAPNDQFGALIGSDLLDRFRDAGLQATGQKRLVTILFVDLSGFTNLSQGIDPEELYEIVQQCSKIFANAVYRYDGMVDKFTGDGLMALFGAPIAHENNAELALRAALDMQADLSVFSEKVKGKIGQELKAHIGLNSGAVIVGGIGSNMMMNYTAIGDVVNRASRIMDKAVSGTILVSERIYRQERGLFNFTELPPVSIKGVAEPIQTYRLESLRKVASSTRVTEDLFAPMIGRDGDFDRLQQTANQLAADHSGRFISVTGEAGIGKSRLVTEFSQQLSHMGFRVIRGQSFVYRKSITFWLLQNIILNLLDIEQTDDQQLFSDSLYKSLETQFGHEINDILPYFEYLYSISHRDAQAAKFIGFLPPDQLRGQLFRWCRELIFIIARRDPIMIALEDFHWADSASLDFIGSLVESMGKEAIMLIAVHRPMPDPALQAVFNRAQESLRFRATNISLGPLSADQTSQLISQLTSISHYPEELINDIVTRAAGIPLYAEEIIRVMRDNGVLHKQDGKWQVNPDADLRSMGISDTLEGLILTRFDNLDPITRHLLKTASVIGRTFSLPLLKVCLPKLNESETNDSLVALIQKGFIDKDPTVGDDYLFRNLLISETIYSTQLKKERKEIHGIVGKAIEQVYGENLPAQVDLLARHFFWSDYQEKGLHYQYLAAKNAFSRFNSIQAKEYYENAESLISVVNPSTDVAIGIYEGLGEVLTITANYPEARARLETALAICPQITEEERIRRAALLRKIGFTYDKQGEIELAITKLGLASAQVEGLDANYERANILSDKGWIEFKRGRLEEAEMILIQAEKYANSAQDQNGISQILNRLGGLYFEKNDIEKAREYTFKSLEQWKLLGNLFGLAKAYNNLALLEWKQGQWQSALNHFREGEVIQKKVGSTEGLAIIYANMGLIKMDMGDIPEAINLINTSRNLANESGHRANIALTTLYLGKANAADQKWDLAIDHLTKAEKLLPVLEDPEYMVDVLLDLSQVYARAGNTDAAIEKVNEAGQYFVELEDELQEYNRGRLAYTNAEISFCRGNYQEAITEYEHAAAIMKRQQFELEQAKALAGLYTSHSQLNQQALGLQAGKEAIAIFHKLGAKLDEERLKRMMKENANHR